MAAGHRLEGQAGQVALTLDLTLTPQRDEVQAERAPSSETGTPLPYPPPGPVPQCVEGDTRAHTLRRTHTRAHTHACTLARTLVCTLTRMLTHTHKRAHTQMHTHVHAHEHTQCTHTHPHAGAAPGRQEQPGKVQVRLLLSPPPPPATEQLSTKKTEGPCPVAGHPPTFTTWLFIAPAWLSLPALK